MSIITKNKLFPILLSVFFLVIHFSCQKEFSVEGIPVSPGGVAPDLSTKVTSSVSGFVTDENNTPVKGSSVVVGGVTTTTDKYGYFQIKNVQVVKDAAVVTVTNPGYFKGIRTYSAVAGKTVSFRIKLIPKTNIGNINSSSGGNVSTNGLGISLPAAAVVNAATGAAYTGTINVAAYYIDPSGADLNMIMPGDMRAVNAAGALKLLKTFGMAAVELTGASGELLQIADGKKATLTVPVPSILLTDAPQSIPLWYFDEATGLWKEQGSAVKIGNAYVGDVSHFSYWNCDFPFPDAVQFSCTVLDVAGNPVPDAQVWISYSNGVMTGCHGATDSSGYVSGAIPANSQLILSVVDYSCVGSVLYSQTFTTTSSNISIGNITITSSHLATLTGSLLNCSGQPVSNGYLMLNFGNHYYRYNVTNPGNFSFNTVFCGNINTVDIIGGDNSSGQESTIGTFPIASGNNNIGSILACGNSNQEFINYTINGTPYSLVPPAATLYQTSDTLNPNLMRISGYSQSNSIVFTLTNQNIATGSTQNLASFLSSQTNAATVPASFPLNITEYGNIGQFVSGNFAGTVTGTSSYAVTCNFRVRRNF